MPRLKRKISLGMGQTPPGIISIFDAAMNDDVEALEVALQYVDVNVTNENGLTALHFAAGYSSERVIDRLLEEPDIDPTIEDINGRRASFVAIDSLSSRSTEIAKRLRPFCYPGLVPDAE